MRDRFLLTGSIDLYSRTDDSALVVDYKSGRQGEIDDLEEHYRFRPNAMGLAVLRDGCRRARRRIRQARGR